MFIRIADVRLFFDIHGSKLAFNGPEIRERPTLLVLHGGPGLDHSAERPAFDALAAIGQVVYLDQRGHGRSDHSSPDRWTLSQWADDVRAFCDTLEIEHPVVIGTSFGGYVAMHYAMRYPDHLSRLILISTSLRGTANHERREHVLKAFERRGGARALHVARRVLDERTPEAFEEYSRVCGPISTRVPPEPDAVQRVMHNREILSWFERPGGEGATFDLGPELRAVRCPTLILGGEDDPITPPAEQQEIANAMLPGVARFVCLAQCGHGVWRDAPDRAFGIVAEFLAGPA